MKAEKNEPSADKTPTLEQFQETVLQEQLTPLWMGAAGQLRETAYPNSALPLALERAAAESSPIAQIDSAWS
jgi:hypothetical protein